jgi:predicted ester cyclase
MMEDKIQRNIKIVTDTLKAFNSYDMDGFTKNMSDSILDFIPGRPAPLIGPKAIRDDNSGFLTIFPDAQFNMSNVFGQGDWVCVEGFFEGTHKGPFPVPGGKPIPATGRKIKVSQCMVVKMHQGKLVEIHEYFSHLDFVNQLGIEM